MKDLIFFVEDGLSSTSANHIANMAKEAYQELEHRLENISFYEVSKGLLDQADVSRKVIVRKGNDSESLKSLEEDLLKIAGYKSLIAWLREAIKAKEMLFMETANLTLAEYCKIKGIEEPKMKSSDKSPERQPMLTESEYYASLPLAQRNRYYELETKVATIGKFIHEGGSFSVARRELDDVINNPCDIIGQGHESIIVENKPTVERGEVEDVFYKLQKMHREYQKELNTMKSACQKAVFDSTTESNHKFEEEVQRIKREDEAQRNIYFSQVAELEAAMSTYINEEKERLKSLKILIPDSLKSVYNEINRLGQ